MHSRLKIKLGSAEGIKSAAATRSLNTRPMEYSTGELSQRVLRAAACKLKGDMKSDMGDAATQTTYCWYLCENEGGRKPTGGGSEKIREDPLLGFADNLVAHRARAKRRGGINRHDSNPQSRDHL